MIYRVEIRKTGEIASCDLVESALKNGGRVFYVEANSPAEACTKAKGDWARLRMSHAGYRQCVHCGKRCEVGRSVCRECLDAKSERQRTRERLKRTLDPNEYAARMAENRHLAQLKTAEKGAVANRDRTDKIWDSPSFRPPVGSNHRTALRQCLRAYDRDPEHFREWLLEKLGISQMAAAE